MPSLNVNESMNGAWIEVFKSGVHTDSSGNTENWTPEKIDTYLAKYNPAHHEAPLRVDHVEPGQRNQNGPAFGWIEAAKRVGDTVYVKLTQVSRQFEDWVRQGFIKKRSIAFDAQKGIHHLAFLGYNCPAVPGMKNVYSDGGNITVIEHFTEVSMDNTLNSQASMLVAEYNKTAGVLSDIVDKLWLLKRSLNDQDGNIIISGDGWHNNALSCVPMLRMKDGTFPVVSPNGKTSLTTGAPYSQAAALVDEYNKTAGILAGIIDKLWNMRRRLNDQSGTIIISGDGWKDNALSCLPMLRMKSSAFPVVSPNGKFYQSAVADQVFIRMDSFSEANPTTTLNGKEKPMNKAIKNIYLTPPTGANSQIVFDGIRQLASNYYDAADTINHNNELTTEAKNKRLNNLFHDVINKIHSYNTMVNSCLQTARSIAQDFIDKNSQNMGRNGDPIRQSATWRALETKKIYEIGGACNWSPEFMGAVLNAPPGVVKLNDLDKRFLVDKFEELLPDTYNTAITEAENINSNLGAVLIMLSAAAGNVSYKFNRLGVPDLVTEILFP